MPAEGTSPALARQFVKRSLSTQSARFSDLLLCVTELVANAVLHAGTDCEVNVSRDRDDVRVEVRDFAPSRMPVPRNYDRDAPTGRGLLLVDALTDRWGIDVDDDGKTVWIELNLTPEGSDA